MHINQQIYRDLFEQLLFSESDNEYDEFIAPWLERVDEERAWLRDFAAKAGNPYPTAEIEDLWRLYALSRVNDLCILRFQPHGDPAERGGWYSSWDGPHLMLDQYVGIFESLGLNVVDHDSFHPFFHEIVQVEESDDADEPISVIEVKWPCLMLGTIMFSRAGVSVRGGMNYVRQKIAQNSTNYWTYRRKYKRHTDLSDGWGSNSQWRTSFRRDYATDGRYFYNVDPAIPRRKVDLSDENVVFDASRVGNATRIERIELLRNRCFIHAEISPDNDLWPYDDVFQEPQ